MPAVRQAIIGMVFRRLFMTQVASIQSMMARSRCQCLVIKINESTDWPFVRTLREGRVQLEYRGTKLRWRELPARPIREQSKALPVKPARGKAPGGEPSVAATGVGVGGEYWRGVKAHGRTIRAAAGKGVVAQTCDTTGLPGRLLLPTPPDMFGA